MYRSPVTSEREAELYYKSARYRSGFTTECPSREQLKKMREEKFRGTPKDFSRYLEILVSLGCGPGDRVLDFGCSWGYGAWQFADYGFDVTGIEPSEARARFAKNELGIKVYPALIDVKEKFDIFFSAHVLEHVSRLRDVIKGGLSTLCNGGFFVSITPNGSEPYRKKNPGAWQRSWGLKHPQLLDNEFLERRFDEYDYLVTSRLSDLQAVRAWSEGRRQGAPLDGPEILTVVRYRDGNGLEVPGETGV